MAKRTKSALKANRQNIKRREHNRQMRSKLRSALKAIRVSLEAKDLSAAKAALSQTVSIVDKMATKGIIHSNTAGRDGQARETLREATRRRRPAVQRTG